MLGGWEIVLILSVVLILFGARKLPELAKGLGQGIKEFKKASNEIQSEIHGVMDDDLHSSHRQIDPPVRDAAQSKQSDDKPTDSGQPSPANKA
jgi:sec-independent protein translocase protein TatA